MEEEFLNLCFKLITHKILIKLPNFTHSRFLSSKKNMNLSLLLFFREVEEIDMNSWCCDNELSHCDVLFFSTFVFFLSPAV